MDGNPNIQKAYESILNHDFEQAIEWFEQAIADEPDNASYHYRLSITFARSNKLAKAVEHAEAACRLDSASEAYRLHQNTVNARMLLYKANELLNGADALSAIKAIHALKQAVQLDPLSVEALLMLSVAYEEAGRLQDALAAAAEAVKLEPHHKEVGEQLEQLLRRMNSSKE